MAGVIGVGGVFFRSANTQALREWYRDVLGMAVNAYGGADFLHADTARHFPNGARTILSPFAADTDYFGEGGHDFMLNFIVDDLSGVLARAEAAGAIQSKPRESYDYGHFGWLTDPDGRRIELWQPIEPAEPA